MVSIGLALGAGMLNRAKRNIEEDKAREAAELAYKRKRTDEIDMLNRTKRWDYDIANLKEENARKLEMRKRTISIVPGIGFDDVYSKFANVTIPEGMGEKDIPGQIFNQIDRAAGLDKPGFRKFVGDNWNTAYAFHLKGQLVNWLDSSNRTLNEKGATNTKGGTTSIPGFQYFLPNIYKMKGAPNFFQNEVVPEFLNKTLGNNSTIIDSKQTTATINGEEVPVTDLKSINNKEKLASVEQGISQAIVDNHDKIFSDIKNKKGQKTGRYTYNASNFKDFILPYVFQKLPNERRPRKQYKVIIDSLYVDFPDSVFIPGGGKEINSRIQDKTEWGTPKTTEAIKNNERMFFASEEIDWMINRYVDLHVKGRLNNIPASAGSFTTELLLLYDGIVGPGGLRETFFTTIGGNILQDARNGILRPLEELFGVTDSEQIKEFRKRIIGPTGTEEHRDKYINPASADYKSGEQLSSKIIYDDTKTFTTKDGKTYKNARAFIDKYVTNAGAEIQNYKNLKAMESIRDPFKREAHLGDLASIRTLQIMLAYRFAVIIQGGEGGRTVSDFDFAQALEAVGANKQITNFDQVMGYIGEVQAKTLRTLPISYTISEYGHHLSNSSLLSVSTDIGNYQSDQLSVYAGWGKRMPKEWRPEDLDITKDRNWLPDETYRKTKKIIRDRRKIWDKATQRFKDVEPDKPEGYGKDVYGKERIKPAPAEREKGDSSW